LNEAHRPYYHGVRVALGKGYNRVRGTGRESRNGHMSLSSLLVRFASHKSLWYPALASPLEVLSHRLAMRLRREGFAHLMTRDAAFFDDARDGDLVLRAGKDVDLLQRTTVKLLGRFVPPSPFLP
jgi:ABC-type multidrug transport system fused ATPase/permease subunit